VGSLEGDQRRAALGISRVSRPRRICRSAVGPCNSLVQIRLHGGELSRDWFLHRMHRMKFIVRI